MSEAQTFSSVDDLFSTSIDDLADLPSFETPAPGAYILKASCDVKKINDKEAIEAAFEVVEVVELKNANDKAVVPGTKFSSAFFLDNEFGVGNLKKFLAPFAIHFGQQNIGTLIREDMKDVLIAATVTNRKDKHDPEKVYATVTNISVQ